VRVDFSIFDRKKKIRYTLVVKTDVFFLTKPSYFRIHILRKKNSSKTLLKVFKNNSRFVPRRTRGCEVHERDGGG